MYTTEVCMTIYRVTSYVSLIKRKRRDGCLMPPFFVYECVRDFVLIGAFPSPRSLGLPISKGMMWPRPSYSFTLAVKCYGFGV